MALFGTTILAEGTAPIEADVVFVHGLAGNSHATWEKDGKMWPRDFLVEKVPHARIMTWGYDSNPMHFFLQQGHQTILSHSQDLLQDIHLERETPEERTRPIVFVGHSLGGLVIKQALCKADEYVGQRRNARQSTIGTYCSGIVFMGTPHRGAGKASWATTATRLAKSIGKDGNDDIVASLKAGSPTLEGLQHSFAGIQGRFIIHTVLESQSMYGMGKVVEDCHATLGCDNEACFSVPADHRNMCKFSHNRDPGYRRVAGAIRDQVEDARPRLDQSPAHRPQALGCSPLNLQAMPPTWSSVVSLPSDSPPPYAEYLQGSRNPTNAFNFQSLRESLSIADLQGIQRSRSASFDRPQDQQSPSKPPLPPRRDKSGSQATFRRLHQQAIAIEGPCPPEKYQAAIDLLRKEKQWVSSLEVFKTVFEPGKFDPESSQSKGELLFLASYVGDEAVVRSALAAGADAEYVVPLLSSSPLHAAMTFDHSKILEMLLETGATLLSASNAAGTNEQKLMGDNLMLMSPTSVNSLLKYRGTDAFPSSAVLIAAKSSQPGVLQVLLNYGFDFHLKNEQGATALHIAVQNDQTETVTCLLSLNFPIDVVDNARQTPLYDAILSRNQDMVNLLLANHAQCNTVDTSGNAPIHILIVCPQDGDGSPLNSDALAECKVNMIESLCQAGASLEIQNNQGLRPLHLAIQFGLGIIAIYLLMKGADPGARNKDGWTPLHLCAAGTGEQKQIAAYLLEAGASLKATSPPPNPLTPLEVARRIPNVDMVNLFSGKKAERGVHKWMARHGFA